MRKPMEDLTNRKFGDRIILGFAYKKSHYYYWFCKCKCGKIVPSTRQSIMGSKTCGCSKYTHKMSYTRFYKVYRKIIERCTDKNHKFYHNYGGRGIKIIWKDFLEFKQDMFASYKKHVKKYGERQTQIDRVDNNGNYCKENCRWATTKEQVFNRRNTRFITFNGKKKTVDSWSKELGIKYTTLLRRINKKWSLEDALKPSLYKIRSYEKGSKIKRLSGSDSK